MSRHMKLDAGPWSFLTFSMSIALHSVLIARQGSCCTPALLWCGILPEVCRLPQKHTTLGRVPDLITSAQLDLYTGAALLF